VDSQYADYAVAQLGPYTPPRQPWADLPPGRGAVPGGGVPTRLSCSTRESVDRLCRLGACRAAAPRRRVGRLSQARWGGGWL